MCFYTFLIHCHPPSLFPFPSTFVRSLNSINVSSGQCLPHLLHGCTLTHSSVAYVASGHTCTCTYEWSQMIIARLTISLRRSALNRPSLTSRRSPACPFPHWAKRRVYSTAVTSLGGALAVAVQRRSGSEPCRAEPIGAERNCRDQQLWRRLACGSDPVEREPGGNFSRRPAFAGHIKGKHARFSRALPVPEDVSQTRFERRWIKGSQTDAPSLSSPFSCVSVALRVRVQD